MSYVANQIMTIQDIYDNYAFNVIGIVSYSSLCTSFAFEQPKTQMFTKTFNDNNKYKYYYTLLPQSSGDSSSSHLATLKLREGWSILNDETNKLVRYKDLYLTMTIEFIVKIENTGVSVGWQLYNYSQVFTKNMKGQLNYSIVLKDNTTNTKYYNDTLYSINASSLYNSSGNIISYKSESVSNSWFKQFMNVNTNHDFTAWVVIDSNTTGDSGQVKLNAICRLDNNVKDTSSTTGADTSGTSVSGSTGVDIYYLPDGNTTYDQQEFLDEWNRQYEQSDSLY